MNIRLDPATCEFVGGCSQDFGTWADGRYESAYHHVLIDIAHCGAGMTLLPAGSPEFLGNN